MARSNSKISKAQKAELKAFKRKNPDAVFFSDPDTRVTLLIVPTGTGLVQVFSSVCSEEETRFRRKVGEYHAMMRYESSDSGLILPEPISFGDLADSIFLGLPDSPLSDTSLD